MRAIFLLNILYATKNVVSVGTEHKVESVSVGMGSWGWERGDGTVGMGAWGWEHGYEIMGMRAWDEKSGIRECGWEHDELSMGMAAC